MTSDYLNCRWSGAALARLCRCCHAQVTSIVLVTQALHAVLEQVDELPATRLQNDPMSLSDALANAGYRGVRLHVLEPAVEVRLPCRLLGGRQLGDGLSRDAAAPATAGDRLRVGVRATACPIRRRRGRRR